MKVAVQLVNERGRNIPAKERGAMRTYRGVLRIHEVRHQGLGRICVTAHLVCATDTTELDLLPALHDAAVLFLRDGRMRVRGFEVMDGAQYGQTWDVRVS
jgi:hypothetical protein